MANTDAVASAADLQQFLAEARSGAAEATAADDSFHPPTGDHPFWTETVWYSFCVPERRLQGWVYSVFRPNIGRCASSLFVWDDSGHTVDEALYAATQSYLPMPEQDLTKVELANGVRYERLEPLQRYSVAFDDDELGLSLNFDGVHPPQFMAFQGMGHIDQIGRVTGRLRLHGEPIAVDCLSIRDRSWSIRQDTGPLRGHYDTVVANEGHLMVTNSGSSHDTIEGGYLVRDGRSTRIVSGERRVRRSGSRPVAVTLTVTDTEGQTAIAEGHAVNGLQVLLSQRFFTTISLMEWSLDGEHAWGEDNDAWSLDQLRAQRRAEG